MVVIHLRIAHSKFASIYICLLEFDSPVFRKILKTSIFLHFFYQFNADFYDINMYVGHIIGKLSWQF